ncbi:MAG: saccharopine dehydrogenase NADP-binding domain-containing protein [Proteobacteria bacterium]|nr:saccharopine dehydrogenase NADP-binding domain-containing protein [Pseudomonadota bacterium]
MRVVVAGGAGDVGSNAVADLVESDGVESVVIADRDITAAAKLAEGLSGRGATVEALEVDANDHDQLVAAFSDCDVVASALGPFFRFEPLLAAAALAAGSDYVSVCDEWEPAGQVLDQFHQPAVERGVTVLTGMGVSPGITNLVIARLINELDRADSADVYVYQPLDAGGGEAVLRHMLHIMSGYVYAWRGGEDAMIAACSESREVEFATAGSLNTWNMGHSEPRTLPHYFPALDEVGFYMGFGSGSRLLVEAARWGVFSVGPLRELSLWLLQLAEGLFPANEPVPGELRIDVTGEKDGEPCTLGMFAEGTMGGSTGASLSVAAQMLVRGEQHSGPGAWAPEGCLDASAFVGHMRSRGLVAWRDLARTVPFE